MKSAALSFLLLVPGIGNADDGIDSLRWLSGCWAAEGQEQGSIEYWMAPAGGSMFGVTRTVRDKMTTTFEYMRIVTESSGDIVFVASPAGQETATFTLKSLVDNEVAFENLQHDFPQRVIYRLEQADRLIGRIEGSINGVSRSVDFPMTRISCDDDIAKIKT
ncbi:MAG: hypothetical protein DRQ63_01530 [Gammaproteobacteria bacterium]|nr:MAG: hypothetical protein DRQ63_01530 [Gammaproteobacteria bacterium]